jgi:signal transduction histidine kinase
MQQPSRSPFPGADEHPGGNVQSGETDRKQTEATAPAKSSQRGFVASARPSLEEGPFKAVWIGPALVLARRAVLDGRTVTQGVWINWPHLRESLRENITDLFPQAELRPALASGNLPGSRLLATIPVELVPPLAKYEMAGWTPMRLSLVVVWLCLALAAMAVGALLHGTVSLSERRAAFVSAVTHELRTPLTTFRMYSEMLAGGMIGDATKRQQYLATLSSEANRLSHLVDNVLAFARLERGSARRRVERLTVGALIERVQGRLAERASRCEMELLVEANPHALGTEVHVDVAAVDQILFNLVDNACKYAAPSARERLIHLEASPDGKFARLRVRDHGPGIGAEGAKRLFKPFNKSAHEAAHTAPGIGLGLALCRRLSRSIGGDLRLDRSFTNGACFVLSLPLGGAEVVALDGI